MSIQIVQASPQSDTAETPRRRVTVGSIRYPFAALEVGQAFTVPLATANVRSLRQLVRRHSQGDKRFVLVIHESYNVVEIARKEPLPVAVAPVAARPWEVIPASQPEATLQPPQLTDEQRNAIFGAPPQPTASWGPAQGDDRTDAS